MTLAIVNVLPEPVTPSSVWCASPRCRPSVRPSMAWGWSPVGRKSETILNSGMSCNYRTYVRTTACPDLRRSGLQYDLVGDHHRRGTWHQLPSDDVYINGKRFE